MALALAVFSFIWAALIISVIPTKSVRESIPKLAIALWLGSLNVIHGVNAVLWVDNTNIHIPVWCDIVTKVMLGVNVALPGAFLCIAVQLRSAASLSKLSTNPTVLRNRKLLEYFLCYILPLIYMASHFIVQDSRFDIVSELGCTPATHPSTLGFLIMWIPPVLVSVLVFVFSAMSIHNSKQPLPVSFTEHLQSRCSITSKTFFRRLAMCMIITGSLCILSFSALFSVPKYKPWISFASVHSTMDTISIVKDDSNADKTEPHSDLTNIQIAWWGMFIVSVIYVLLSVATGDEFREAFTWIKETATSAVTKKRSTPPRDLLLPVYNINLNKPPPSPASEWQYGTTSSSAKSVNPLTLDLKSGWDDTLNEKTPRRMELLRSPRTPSPQDSPTTPTRAMSLKYNASIRSVSSATRSTSDDDKAFMESTMQYLGSPTAKTLGLAPLQIPPPSISPPLRTTFELPTNVGPSSPTTPKRKERPVTPRRSPTRVPQDVEPTLGSVLNESWPVPPTSPTPSLASSTRFGGRARSRSRSHSPASSAEEIVASALPPFVNPSAPHREPAQALAHAHVRPFATASASSFIIPDDQHRAASPVGRMASLVGPSMRTLGAKQWSRERLRHAGHSAEGIQMTVVHETVVHEAM